MNYPFGTPPHLKFETYFKDEIQHVKDHVLMMHGLSKPELHAQELRDAEDWQQLIYSFNGQFIILFGSLQLIRKQIGEDHYAEFVEIAKQARAALEAGDHSRGGMMLLELQNRPWRKPRAAKGGPKA